MPTWLTRAWSFTAGLWRSIAFPLTATCAVLVIGFLVILSSSLSYCTIQSSGRPKPRIEQLQSGTIVFDAPIDDQTAAAVIDLLKHPRVPITSIDLNSYGGFARPSRRIADVIESLPKVPISVPAHATCQSACVELLAASPDTLDLAPTSTLMFHSAADRSSLSDCWICRQVNGLSVWYSMHKPWNDNQAMLPWAAKLSPALPILFNLCAENPLETQAGLTITGGELNGLRSGSIKPEQLTQHCPPAN